MILIVYSAYDARTVAAALGDAEYSYWFVRRAFRPVLEKFGIVVPVTDPAQEVPAIAAAAEARGQPATFLTFEPPHKTVLGLRCRTIPVFAWEFDTLPDEVWDDEPRNDWRRVLAACGSAITHSRAAVETVRAAMGADFPVWAAPAPVWDSYAADADDHRPPDAAATLSLDAIVLDSRQLDLAPFALARCHGEGVAELRRLAAFAARPDQPPCALTLDGVVYTAVLNPVDGRKNLVDLLAGFIAAFRNEPGATLVLKLAHFDLVRGLRPTLSDLYRHGTFACRVVIVHGMISGAAYRALIGATTYAVNASTNEGQCLPLMEAMSAGRPAIAPAHTALADYVLPDNAFVVPTSPHPWRWPHDSRQALRTHRNIVDFAALVGAYRESYRVARQQPARWHAMSRAATASLRDFCSDSVVAARLGEALHADPHGADAAPPRLRALA